MNNNLSCLTIFKLIYSFYSFHYMLVIYSSYYSLDEFVSVLSGKFMFNSCLIPHRYAIFESPSLQILIENKYSFFHKKFNNTHCDLF